MGHHHPSNRHSIRSFPRRNCPKPINQHQSVSSCHRCFETRQICEIHKSDLTNLFTRSLGKDRQQEEIRIPEVRKVQVGEVRKERLDLSEIDFSSDCSFQLRSSRRDSEKREEMEKKSSRLSSRSTFSRQQLRRKANVAGNDRTSNVSRDIPTNYNHLS